MKQYVNVAYEEVIVLEEGIPLVDEDVNVIGDYAIEDEIDNFCGVIEFPSISQKIYIYRYFGIGLLD